MVDNKFEFHNYNGESFGKAYAYQPGFTSGLTTTYDCKSGAIHVPSEHTVDNDNYDLEMQIRCTADDVTNL
jgi:carbonic anhydrase